MTGILASLGLLLAAMGTEKGEPFFTVFATFILVVATSVERGKVLRVVLFMTAVVMFATTVLQFLVKMR